MPSGTMPLSKEEAIKLALEIDEQQWWSVERFTASANTNRYSIVVRNQVGREEIIKNRQAWQSLLLEQEAMDELNRLRALPHAERPEQYRDQGRS